MKSGKIVILLFLCCSLSGFALTINDARDYMRMSDYNSAMEIITELLGKKQRAATTAELNAMAGECCFMMGNIDSAKEYLSKAIKKNVLDAYLTSARIAFIEYRFSDALELYSQYENKAQRSKVEISDEFEDEKSAVVLANGMLDRVERIAIIDSIAVDKDDFLSVYRLTPESGSISKLENGNSEFGMNITPNSTIFLNEDKDFALWSVADSLGVNKLEESVQLVGGGWQPSSVITDLVDDGEDAAYPFMLSDGQTMYFASNGENSIGGYDIFRSNRDSDTGEYMAPQNIGMPYNSPYDDYMLAVDESIGVGWWATDRNRLQDNKLTVYLYVVNDVRENYSPDDESIINYAKISDYKSTWNDNEDYASYHNAIKEINVADQSESSSGLFKFPISSKIVYSDYDDFRTAEGRKLMEAYINLENEYENDCKDLRDMRIKFHQAPDISIGNKIAGLESKTEKTRNELRQLKSKIIRMEK